MAAARNLLQIRRVLSVLTHNNQLGTSSFNKEPAWQFLPSTTSIFARNDFYRRRFQTQSNPASQPEDSQNHESSCPNRNCESDNAPSDINSNEDSPVKYSAVSSLKTSPRHDLAMIFTCKVCETRSVKTICRESYEKGVVVARCGGCNNLHLIADRLGWFGEPGSIEDFLAARGEEVRKGSTDTLNLTLEDLAGNKILKE
ncbi:uncharacterized protein LOC8268559 [Ricinus communis]|uniref:DNL-type domain-containing protein n=1 Tax=Ricinus communis TaxID=3988 RepID=B9SY63_RICCO|nr:uncharacterized protein LOC8268559 [Ricinus communis]EEF31447.1 conserved hypothetical protein [Ricinus communis]|eukprot:XP_002530932.1 uncharacterized protein LOC8268559 [Ricinus communis]